MNTITIRLPWPPSVNHYYGRSRRGRVFLKPAGRMYRKRVASILGRMGNPRLDGFVSIHLLAAPPDRRRRDLDNIRKAAWDALSDRPGHRGVIADDALIRKDSAEFTSPDGDGWILATLAVLEERPSA
jgi:crossover junction endodeoxyribonuclease RusA